MLRYNVTVNGKTHEAQLVSRETNSVTFIVNSETHTVSAQAILDLATPISTGQSAQHHQAPVTPVKKASSNELLSPMPGVVMAVSVKVGEQVIAGATVAVIEAMKMENPITVSRDCTIEEIHVKKGQEIGKGALVVKIK